MGPPLVLLLALAAVGLEENNSLVFSLEAAGHFPTGVEIVQSSSDRIDLGQLSPPLHELALVYGVRVPEIDSDVVMRLGYRYAQSDLPAASLVGNEPATEIALGAVPLTVGWRWEISELGLRPFVGLDVGGSFARIALARPASTPATSGWRWLWELRGLAGAHYAVNDWLGVRLFLEGRLSAQLATQTGPDFSATGLGIGVAAVVSCTRQVITAWFTGGDDDDDDDDGLLPEYEIQDAGPTERAFAEIRAGDEAMKQSEFSAAAARYAAGLRLLPRDPQTQRNVAAPVNVDLARARLQLGDQDGARAALTAALEIVPDFAAARELLDSL